jgi:hypothetical protein
MKVSRRRERAVGRAEVGRRFGLTLVMIAFTPTLGRSQPDSKLAVRVYNYAHVSDATLASAEAEAGRIFGAAGVDSVWLDCSEPYPVRHQSGLCRARGRSDPYPPDSTRLQPGQGGFPRHRIRLCRWECHGQCLLRARRRLSSQLELEQFGNSRDPRRRHHPRIRPPPAGTKRPFAYRHHVRQLGPEPSALGVTGASVLHSRAVEADSQRGAEAEQI